MQVALHRNQFDHPDPGKRPTLQVQVDRRRSELSSEAGERPRSSLEPEAVEVTATVVVVVEHQHLCKPTDSTENPRTVEVHTLDRGPLASAHNPNPEQCTQTDTAESLAVESPEPSAARLEPVAVLARELA